MLTCKNGRISIKTKEAKKARAYIVDVFFLVIFMDILMDYYGKLDVWELPQPWKTFFKITNISFICHVECQCNPIVKYVLVYKHFGYFTKLISKSYFFVPVQAVYLRIYKGLV